MQRFDVLCIGTALIDSIITGFDPEPISASGYRAGSGSLHVGGEAVNEAIALAKLDKKVAIFASLGKDEAGDMIAAYLKKGGVDTSFLLRSEHPTPVTTMFVREDGSRRSITNQAHFHNFHPERYLSDLPRCRALILGSLFRAPFDEPEVIFSVLSWAKENGIAVYADTKLPNHNFLTLGDIAESLPLIGCITPNEDEARYYSGKEDPEEMAEVFLNSGAESVIIKLGAKGCYYRDRNMSLSLPAFPVRAVDATGAGDNFLAGFISERLEGKEIEEALRFANTCGAVCASAQGASAGLQNREQILSLIGKEY